MAPAQVVDDVDGEKTLSPAPSPQSLTLWISRYGPWRWSRPGTEAHQWGWAARQSCTTL